MSKLWIKVDYCVAATIINGMRSWLDKMEEILDNAKKDLDKKDFSDDEIDKLRRGGY